MLNFPSTHEHGPWARIDPRIKVLLCFGLVALTFGADRWPALVLLGAVVGGLLLSARLPLATVARSWWSLRWLLLFTILLHLLFSPGQVLFGSRWLSYDGLLRGLFVAGQISLALLAALLLSLTLSPDRLAAVCGWFLAPLKFFRLPVQAWQTQILLVVKFIPRIRGAALFEPVAGEETAGMRRGGRIGRFAERLIRIFDRLIDEAEVLARRIVKGEEVLTLDVLPTGDLLTARNGLMLLAGSAVAGGFFWLNMP